MKILLKGLCAVALLLLAALAIGFAKNRWLISKYQPQIEFNSQAWYSTDAHSTGSLTLRQQMVRDLITKVLPGKSKQQIHELLGKSPTHDEMRRLTPEDFKVKERDEQGNWKPYPRTGKGYYFDELDWDLIYSLGKEQIFLFDHKGQLMSPDTEDLVIRLDSRGHFESWFIEGSKNWPKVVGKEGSRNYRKTRVGDRSEPYARTMNSTGSASDERWRRLGFPTSTNHGVTSNQ